MQYRHDLGNDRWVVEHLYPGLSGGYFVEAGATNGVNGSATYVLEKELAWSGLCVEPIPQQYRRIKELRTCAADHRALWSRSGLELEFTIYSNRTGRSGLTSINKNAEKMHREGEERQIIAVSTVTLEDALREHGAPGVIDYLCLDVEGAEPEILRSFDFAGDFLIRAISIEGHACDALMAAAGYRRTKNPFTDVTFETYWLHPSVNR
jgi:FkbM family methyltransferase